MLLFGVADFRPDELQHLSVMVAESQRERGQSAYTVIYGVRVGVEIERAVGVCYLRGVGRLEVVLLFSLRRAVLDRRDSVDEQLRPGVRHPVVQLFEVVVRIYRHLDLRDHVTGVEPDIHVHDRDAGNFLSVHDSALNRRGSAVLRKQRAVDVYTAETRVIYHVLRQNLSVRRDDDEVGRESFKQRGEIVIP